MPIIQNVNAVGAVEVPLLRRDVDAGESVEVSDAQAEALLPQAANWQPVDDAAKAIAARVNPPVVDETPAADPTPTPPADATPPVDTPPADATPADATEGDK